MEDKFRIYLEKCNFLISALVIRSLIYDIEKDRLIVDKLRLKDELYFYKMVLKNQKSSIVSALYPLILGNKNLYSGYEEALDLFLFIRKKVTAVEKYSIFILCKLIKSKTISKEDVIEFETEYLNLEDSISLQKAKINSIIGFNRIGELVFEFLEEDKGYMTILDDATIDSTIEVDKYKDLLSGYFNNLCQGKVSEKKYHSFNMDLLETVFDIPVGGSFSFSIIPKCTIKDKIIEGQSLIVTLETKNTTYKVVKGT